MKKEEFYQKYANTPLSEKTKEDWQEVFKQFYDDNESGGSSRWLVTPDTVKIFIKGLLFSQNHEIIQELNKIAKWIDPQPGAGEEIGVLCGVGMYMQYNHDKKQHEDEIAEIINKLISKK